MIGSHPLPPPYQQPEILKTKHGHKLPLWGWAVLFSGCLVVHYLLLLKQGIFFSTDYSHVTQYQALSLADWMRGNGFAINNLLTGYHLFHLGHAFFIAIIFYLFGDHNTLMVAIIQNILSTLAFMMMLRAALHTYSYRASSIVTFVLAIFFFDNMSWNNSLSPEGLYRPLLLLSTFGLGFLYLQKHLIALLFTTILSFLVLISVRPDTAILFLPTIILIPTLVWQKMQAQGKNPKLPILVYLPFVLVTLSLILEWRYGLFSILLDMLWWYFEMGYILYHQIVFPPLDLDRTDDLFYLADRGLRLFLWRIYYYFNPFPPFWSFWHKVLHAAFMIPILFLAILGLVRGQRTKAFFIQYSGWIFLASMILHGITRTDTDLRTQYNTMSFLILIAGYGLDGAWFMFRKRHMLNPATEKSYAVDPSDTPRPGG